MNIVVTGGAGYIGRAVAAELDKAGYDCIAVDNLSTGYRDWVREPLECIDIRDTSALTACFIRNRVEAVIHLAALKSPAESVAYPARYHDVNIAGTKSVLEAATAAQVGKVVFSSSSAVYGHKVGLIAEESPCQPSNPYGETKRAGELLGVDWQTSTAGSFVALRYFNVGGADARQRYGERYRGWPSQIIPATIEATLRGQPVHIYGLDYDTADGSAVRDFVHVDDVARAHVKALRADVSGIFNLGTGRGSSVLQVISEVERSAGVAVMTTPDQRRAGDPESSICDVTLAHNQLHWQAHHDLSDIVDSAWAWRRHVAEDRTSGSRF